MHYQADSQAGCVHGWWVGLLQIGYLRGSGPAVVTPRAQAKAEDSIQKLLAGLSKLKAKVRTAAAA